MSNIEIRNLMLGRLRGRWSAGQRLDEIASVISVAAHDDAQRAVRRAVDFEARSVAVGEAVGRENRRLQFARTVELDRALDAAAGALDQRSSMRTDCGLVVSVKVARAGLPACFDPARQKAVDLRRRQIGLDGEAAVAIGRWRRRGRRA
jgi:hypothetical protein